MGINPSIVEVVQLKTFKSKEWHSDTIIIINILFHAFDAMMAGAEHPIPEACLLAVVVALPPPIAVVEVMILNH